MDFKAVPVKQFSGVTVTDDNQNLLLFVELAEGAAALAVPSAMIRPLLSLLLTGLSRIEGPGEGGLTKSAFVPQSLEVKRSSDGGAVVIFRMGEGALLSFKLDQKELSRLVGMTHALDTQALVRH